MQTFTLPSSREGKEITCYAWPVENPKCTVQILHGMLEYLPRYADTAEYLNSKGISVYGHDHLGHGRSNPTEPGFFNDTDGDVNLVDDAAAVCRKIIADNPGIGHFVMGHSMGSYVTRLFAGRYGDLVDGIIAVATGGRSLEEATYLTGVANKVVEEHGPHAYSEDLDALVLGKNFNRVKSGGRDMFQMTEEMRNRLRFQAAGYRDLFMLTLRLAREDGFGNIPPNLKVAFFSGAEDPVGGMGEGVKKAASALEKYGLAPYVKLYPGKHHDILHEEGATEVYDDIVAWISEVSRN